MTQIYEKLYVACQSYKILLQTIWMITNLK